MIWFYRLLFIPLLLVALPYYGLRMWKRGGYGKDFKHRLGRFHRLPPPGPEKKRIWIQAVSVGEILAIGSLVEALMKERQFEIVLTTTTSTGYAVARKRYADNVLAIGIFPLDFWLFSKSTWKRIQPDAIILTESELWPEHLKQSQLKGIPSFLINARLSNRSYKRYQSIRPVAGRLFKKFTAIFSSSEIDHQRLQQLGASKETTICTGNIKFDASVARILSDTEKQDLKQAMGFTPKSGKDMLILLGSSTWPGEESILLRTQQQLIQEGLDCRLLLVPRHAERANEITDLLKQQTLQWNQRSAPQKSVECVAIYLADTTGELATLSQVADIAFIGKSLAPNTGGQTPIEAASLGIPIIMGPNMDNFKDVSKSLINCKAARSVANEIELQTEVLKLANDPAKRLSMSRAGKEWHTINQGSSQRIADSIRAYLFPPKHERKS